MFLLLQGDFSYSKFNSNDLFNSILLQILSPKIAIAGKWNSCWLRDTVANDRSMLIPISLSLFQIVSLLASSECKPRPAVRSKPYCRLTFPIKSSPPRAAHWECSAHLSALFTVSRTLTNSNLIFCLLDAIASGREAGVKLKSIRS